MGKELLEAIPREKLDPDRLARFEEALGQVIGEMVQRGNEPRIEAMVEDKEGEDPVIERSKADWRMARSVKYRIAGHEPDGRMILVEQ